MQTQTEFGAVNEPSAPRRLLRHRLVAPTMLLAVLLASCATPGPQTPESVTASLALTEMAVVSAEVAAKDTRFLAQSHFWRQAHSSYDEALFSLREAREARDRIRQAHSRSFGDAAGTNDNARTRDALVLAERNVQRIEMTIAELESLNIPGVRR
jgi:hypothetical protein